MWWYNFIMKKKDDKKETKEETSAVLENKPGYDPDLPLRKQREFI